MVHRDKARIHFAVLESSLGPVLVAARDKGVCCIAFGEGERDLAARFAGAELLAAGADFSGLFDKVLGAIERPGPEGLDIPLDIEGTPFQRRVWDLLRAIPAGETRSYGDLAKALGKPGAARAVGGANRANRIAVLIPCHRVIAAHGGLGGYAYGASVKAELLRRERGLASA